MVAPVAAMDARYLQFCFFTCH